MIAHLILLLRALGSPFAQHQVVSEVNFTYDLYNLALANKVALTYLSNCSRSFEGKKLYQYHLSRLRDLESILPHVSDVVERYNLNCVVFKTLKPFQEDVADIDILCMSNSDYHSLVSGLTNLGYVIMEKSHYCTTLMDASRSRLYATELMIDVYREVSVGPLVYLDKRLLLDHVILRNAPGYSVKIFDPVAELLAIVAHSLIKEMEVKLLDYLTALHLIQAMNIDSMKNFIDLVKKARLVYGARLFLSIVANLHALAYGFIPCKVRELLNMLGGPINVHNVVMRGEPPYRLGFSMLARIYVEKLRDPAFRGSMVRGLGWFSSKRSITRLAQALAELL